MTTTIVTKEGKIKLLHSAFVPVAHFREDTQFLIYLIFCLASY